MKAGNGCGESAESELAVAPTSNLPLLPGVILAGSAAVCANEKNLTYAIAPIAGVSTYNWTVPAGWIITNGQGTASITVTAGSAAGEIAVTAFNNCGASPARTTTVSPGTIPDAPLAITGQAIPCAGSTGNTYSVAAVPGVTEYEWTVPAGWVITAGQGTSSITVAAGTTNGNISVRAGNDCGQSVAAVLEVKPSTTVPAIPGTILGSNSVCGTSLDLTYSYSVVAETNASNYIWSVPTGWTITSGQGTLSISVKASNSPGTISVMAENGCGLSMVSILAVSVTAQAPITPGVVVGKAKVCAGAVDETYTVGSVSGASQYTWTVPADWIITAGQGTTTIKVKTGQAAGQVSVVANNGCGISQASTLAVATTVVPVAPLAIEGLKNQCAGTTGSIYRVAPVEGALSYEWTVPADWIITAGQGTHVLVVTAGKVSGEVRVKASNTCGSSEGQVMAVTSATTPSPAPGKIQSDYSGLICSAQAGLVFHIDSIATANSYTWTVPAGWIITGGQGTTSITVTAGDLAGPISVKAVNGCGESNASVLEVNPSRTATVSIGTLDGPAAICSGQAGLVYKVAPVPGATTYTWSLPAGWVVTAGQGSNQITVTAGTAGGEIKVTASNNCAASLPAALAVVLNLTPAAPVQILEKSTACSGLSYAIEAVSGATSYTWTVPAGWSITEGQGTGSIRVSAPADGYKGLITVTANGTVCSSSATTFEADPIRGNTDLTFANVFSPNADGVNDNWEVLNIQNYPENDLVIINRWGNEVYRSKSYQNNWNGGELSAGTYFYVLKVKTCDGSYKTHKGYVMVMR